MKQESTWVRMSRVSLTLVLSAVVATAFAAPLAQQAKEADAAGKSTAVAAEKAPPLRGRLPAYYGKVVSEQQRQQIYAIQTKYQERIVKLTEELASLTEKRGIEVEKVLSDEQRAEIAKLKAARSSSRRSSGADKVAADQP